MSPAPKASPIAPEDSIKIPRYVEVFGVLLLLGLVATAFFDQQDAKNLAVSLLTVQLGWLPLALFLQAMTYVCAGGIWYTVSREAGFRPPLMEMWMLALENLSLNQIVPVVGLAGNVVVIKAMKRMGMPYSLAIEAILVEMIAHIMSFAVLGVVTMGILLFLHDVTAVILWIVTIFTIVMGVTMFLTLWILHHQHWHPPAWIRRRPKLMGAFETLAQVDAKRVKSPAIVVKTTALFACVFLLDTVTLWAAMQSLHAPIGMVAAFVAMIIASMAGAISFLPGGLGSFEAVCVTVLSLFGAPLGEALTGTILLRLLTFWLPLVPGFVLAHREMRLEHLKL